jgi:hypothetical protein
MSGSSISPASARPWSWQAPRASPSAARPPRPVVPGTDRFWVAGSVGSYASATLFSDAGVSLDSFTYNTSASPILSFAKQVFPIANSDTVRLSGSTSFDSYLGTSCWIFGPKGMILRRTYP